MFANNPFATLTDVLPANAMQIYVASMLLAVFGGTLFDIIHKGSAKYFFDNWRKSKNQGSRQIGGVVIVSLAFKTGLVDVLASGEFCNVRRRVAHLLTMYGFVIYVTTTAVMVFAYPTPATPTPAIVPLLWWIGGSMTCLGGYWFWFFIRVDVAAEGKFAAARDARGSIRTLPSGQRDAGSDLGLFASDGKFRGQRVLRFVHQRNDGTVRIGGLVQIRAHVLQACRGV